MGVFGIVVVFRQKCCIRAKVVLIGQSCGIWQKWLYSGKSGCSRSQMAVLGQKWLYSGKVDVFGLKWLNSGKSG